VQAGEDLGELGDVAGVRVQGRAVLPGPGGLVLSSSSRLSGSVRIQLARSRALAVRGRRAARASRKGRTDVAAGSAVSALPGGAGGGAGRRGAPSFAWRPRQLQG
jgi:hypothetical protein